MRVRPASWHKLAAIRSGLRIGQVCVVRWNRGWWLLTEQGLVICHTVSDVNVALVLAYELDTLLNWDDPLERWKNFDKINDIFMLVDPKWTDSNYWYADNIAGDESLKWSDFEVGFLTQTAKCSGECGCQIEPGMICRKGFGPQYMKLL